MKRRFKSFKGLLSFFEALNEDGVLEPTQSSTIRDILRRLDHALIVGDLKTIKKLIGELSRSLQIGDRKRK